jgi:AraC family transcriptional regulator of adaptative response / DNA-3-methyladenine glycosylase II
MTPATAPEEFIAALCELPGIGPWTAHYVAMRALGWPDAFPPYDVAVLKALQRLQGIAGQRAADAHAQAWRPWRSYAVLRLWNSLETPT